MGINGQQSEGCATLFPNLIGIYLEMEAEYACQGTDAGRLKKIRDLPKRHVHISETFLY